MGPKAECTTKRKCGEEKEKEKRRRSGSHLTTNGSSKYRGQRGCLVLHLQFTLTAMEAQEHCARGEYDISTHKLKMSLRTLNKDKEER